jgi:hypothetical protein
MFTSCLPHLAEGFMLPLQLQFSTGRFEPTILDRLVQLQYRVILAMAIGIDMLTIATAAHVRGLVATGWAWLGLDQLGGIEHQNMAAPEQIAKARLALRGWVYFQPFVPNAPTAFYQRARNTTDASRATSAGLGGVTAVASSAAAIGDTATSPYAANMYDAVVLCAMAFAAANATMPNGQQLVQAIRNISFQGVTGEVDLDENLDMLGAIEVMNYNYASEVASQVGVYYPEVSLQQYVPVPTRAVIWPGGSNVIPKDAEASSSPFQISAGVAAIIFGVVAGVVAVVGALCCVCFCKWGRVKCMQSVIPGMGVSSRTVLFGGACRCPLGQNS